jgi:hypothetical protein
MLGFELRESFSGSYYRLGEPLRDHAIRISLQLGVSGLRRFLRDRRVDAAGIIHAEQLAERNPEGVRVVGSLMMRLFDEKRIPYDLSFEGDDGRTYRLRGQRDFFVHDAIDSLTILPASLYDDAGLEIGRAVMRFDARTELPALVKSFRPRLRGTLLTAAGSPSTKAQRD